MGFIARLFGKRQTAPVTQEDTVTHLPPGSGWRLSHRVSDEDMHLLFSVDQIELWHEAWAKPQMANPRALSHAPAVGDLWWRPVT